MNNNTQILDDNILYISLIVNVILLFCLFSPDVCKFIHSKYLTWKDK